MTITLHQIGDWKYSIYQKDAWENKSSGLKTCVVMADINISALMILIRYANKKKSSELVVRCL